MRFTDSVRESRVCRVALSTSTVFACLVVLVHAQAPRPVASAAAAPTASAMVLVVESPIADLGEIALGATGRVATFRITNTGAAPVELSFGRLPPGISPQKLDRSIPAGGNGVAVVNVDTYLVTAVDSHVTVNTSSPEQPRLDLVVRARVRAYVQPSPPSSRFNFVQFERPGSTVHTVFATDTPDLVVTDVSSPVPFITASFAEVPLAEREAEIPGRQWRVSLTIARDAPVGAIGGYVKVTTTHAKQPVLLLPVSGFVRPQFAVTPPTATLDAILRDPASPTVMTLVVKNFATNPIDVRSASIDVRGLAVILSSTDPGRAWRVVVQTTDALQPGPFTGSIVLATASADVPEIRVPVSGNVIAPVRP